MTTPEYFNHDNEGPRVPTMEQIRRALASMRTTEIECRDGARRCHCLDEVHAPRHRSEAYRAGRPRGAHQGVEVVPDLILFTWRRHSPDRRRLVNCLRQEKCFGLDDPLFRATAVHIGEDGPFQPGVSTGGIGRMQARSGPSSRMPSPRLGRRTIIRIHFARRSPRSVRRPSGATSRP